MIVLHHKCLPQQAGYLTTPLQIFGICLKLVNQQSEFACPLQRTVSNDCAKLVALTLDATGLRGIGSRIN